MPIETEPRFSGVPTTPPPEVFERARKNNPVQYQMLEAAYAQFAALPENAGIYPDPKSSGATIQQIWMLFTAFGVEPYCLLSRSLPAGSTQHITRLVNLQPAQLVDALKTIQAANGDVNVPLAYYDGQTGHCIRITSHDAAHDRFTYHDPWPERSLLAKENNAAGVDAQPEGKRWSVTRQELEGVVFAAFVFPRQWARVQGGDFETTYDQWSNSDFFKAFRLKQLSERVEDDHTERVFAPGAFKETIALRVLSANSGKIQRASLGLERKWIIGNLGLALDLARGFIRTFAPAPDRETYTKIATALSSLRDPRNLVAARNADPKESDEMRCIHAFMGSLQRADVTTDFAHLSIDSVIEGDRQFQYLAFDLM